MLRELWEGVFSARGAAAGAARARGRPGGEGSWNRRRSAWHDYSRFPGELTTGARTPRSGPARRELLRRFRPVAQEERRHVVAAVLLGDVEGRHSREVVEVGVSALGEQHFDRLLESH